jgi:excisionase family DNA binding protein
MGEEKLLTVREVSSLLGVSEKEVVDLAEDGSLPAYKVGGVYLRFRSDQVQQFRKLKSPLPHKADIRNQGQPASRLTDFFYFYDFYIVSFVIIAALLYIIFLGR